MMPADAVRYQLCISRHILHHGTNTIHKQDTGLGSAVKGDTALTHVLVRSKLYVDLGYHTIGKAEGT